MIKHTLTLALLVCSLGIRAQGLQGLCQVYVDGTVMNNPTFNGSTVITDPSAPVKIINNFSIPAEDIMAMKEFLQLLEQLSDDHSLNQLDNNSRLKYLEK
ncbi:MAG: hypothetical protein AAFZ15_24125 [Bacteroidota bacterium]